MRRALPCSDLNFDKPEETASGSLHLVGVSLAWEVGVVLYRIWGDAHDQVFWVQIITKK